VPLARLPCAIASLAGRSLFHIERGDLLDILAHPNPDRYAGQRIFVVRRDDYVYLVPFVGRWCAADQELAIAVSLHFRPGDKK
jgi:hypothetical protein